MHSLEELKKQMDAAKSRANEARSKAADAEAKYKAERLRIFEESYEKTGIRVGSKVMAIKKEWNGTVSKTPYFVHSFANGWTHPEVKLCKPKKDGMPSKSHIHVVFDSLELAP